MAANHMPAPWSIVIPSRGPVEIKSRHGLHVGTAYCTPDARLMAAAPELLEALEEIRTGLQIWAENHGDMGGRIVGMMASADAAIANAKGEAQP